MRGEATEGQMVLRGSLSKRLPDPPQERGAVGPLAVDAPHTDGQLPHRLRQQRLLSLGPLPGAGVVVQSAQPDLSQAARRLRPSRRTPSASRTMSSRWPSVLIEAEQLALAEHREQEV